MRWAAPAAVSAALIGIFIALSVSVVDARRPLDGKVTRSFDVVAAGLDVANGEVVPSGCRKQRLYYYDCRATLAAGRASEPIALRWLLVLRADGCWTALRTQPYASVAALGRRGAYRGTIDGCIPS
jgi:hypothetical protein